MSELPFLKNNNKNQGGGGPTITKRADSLGGDHLLGLITDELHESLSKKDHKGALNALRAFVSHVNEKDQDNG